jgi:prepilin-type N-terminal cleavage/methylation domain-containing protein
MTLLHSYLKQPKVQKVLNRKPGEEGFSLIELVVVIAVLAILSAVAIPAFVGVQDNAQAAAVKNGLVNGIKECVVRQANMETNLDFDSVQSFSNDEAFSGFELAESDGLGCMGAVATPTDDKTDTHATFTIEMRLGIAEKTCDDESRPGCNDDSSDNNAW